MKHRENFTQQGILFVLSMVTNTKVLKKTPPKKQPLNPNMEVKNDFASHFTKVRPFLDFHRWHLQFPFLNLHLHLHRNSQTCLKPNLLTSQCSTCFFPANKNSSKIWTNNSPKTGHWQLLVEARWTTHLPSGTRIRCNPPPFQRDFRESFQPTCGRHHPTPGRGRRLGEGTSRKTKWVNLWILIIFV